MYFRQLLNDETACASYLLGCKSKRTFAVVDPHLDLVDDYIELAAAQGIPIAAVLETHVQADHVSGLPALVERTGATAYLPAGSGVEFEHVALGDGEVVKLGNTEVQAIATPGHAAAHHAYLVTDHVRGEETLVRPHRRRAARGRRRPARPARCRRADRRGDGAHALRSLTEKLMTLPDHLALYPAHYSGSVCGRGLSANPISTIGFERRHNPALQSTPRTSSSMASCATSHQPRPGRTRS